MRACLLICLWCCAATAVAQDSKRLPLPGASDLEAAKKVVEEIYKKDYAAAKSPAQKRSLVLRLLDDGLKTKDDPASKFAMLQVAQKIAIGVGDADLALQVGEAVARDYQIDALEQRVEILQGVAALAKLAADHAALLPYLQRTIDRLAKAGRYEEARELASTALASAKKVNDSDLIKQWTRRGNELAAHAKIFEEFTAAKKTLDTAPADRAANDIAGKFLCFVQNEWEQGLTHLALGGDAQIQPLAEQELKRDADRAALAVGWRKAADALPEALQTGALRRAEKHLRAGLSAATGIEKRKLEQQIEELRLRTSPFRQNEWVDLLDYVDPARHAFNTGLKREGDAIVIAEHHDHGYFTIPVTATGGYEIRVRAVRLTPKEEGICLRLPGTQGALYSLNAYTGAHSGMTILNGKDCNENASRTPGAPMPEGEPYVVHVRFEPRGDLAAVTATVNGRKYSRWAGALKALSAPDTIAWKPNQFGVSIWWSKLAVKSFELKVLDGSGYVTE